jgi:hypothetical protein
MYMHMSMSDQYTCTMVSMLYTVHGSIPSHPMTHEPPWPSYGMVCVASASPSSTGDGGRAESLLEYPIATGAVGEVLDHGWFETHHQSKRSLAAGANGG